MPSAARVPRAPTQDGGPPAHGAFAGLVSRVAALLIDVLVLVVASAAVYAVLVGGASLTFDGIPSWIHSVTQAVVSALPTVYFTVAWWLTGQTVGDAVMGVAVRDRALRRLGFVRALLRAVVGLALAPVWLVGLVSVLLDARRRSLLDMVFGTVVVYAPARRRRPVRAGRERPG
ncbi:RDD family protein [Streptosporangiaceae bacterium NEAU-GS5]|nr:RDD family protein [Streptosporangiaceae bacterium NEAU-GS5]